MEKPIILIEKEMREEVVEMINKYISQLPATMIISAIKDTLGSLNDIAERQLNQAIKDYEESKEDGNNG
jgi:hypothetical protein